MLGLKLIHVRKGGARQQDFWLLVFPGLRKCMHMHGIDLNGLNITVQVIGKVRMICLMCIFKKISNFAHVNCQRIFPC